MSGYESLITFVKNYSEFKESSSIIKNWKEHLDTLKEECNKTINNPIATEINSKDFEYLNVLGKGSFGKVLLAFHKTTKEYFAVKVLNKHRRDGRLKHLINEKNILLAIHFRFIVEMKGYFENKRNLYFVLQLVPGGDLSQLLDKLGHFGERLSKFYAAQVLLALEYLHHINIIYRDLKPENILMDIRGYLKLTDLGLSKHLQNVHTYTLCGTPEYMAPEIILNQGYGKSVDFWAFGILIFEFNSGYTPFHSKSNLLTFAKITKGDYKMEPFFSEKLKHLIDNLLQKDISRRFGILKDGIEEIKHHDWFSGIMWLALANKNIWPPFVPEINDIEARLRKKSGSVSGAL